MKRILALGILLIFLGLGFLDSVDASLEFEEYQVYEVEQGPECLNTADIDGDGDQDMVMICNGDIQISASSIVYLINSGSGGFEKRTDELTNTPYLLDVADMDGDGDADIVLMDNSSVRILSNNGAGEFTETWSHEFSTLLYSTLSALDLNGDGKRDIAFFDSVFLHLFLSGGGDYTYRKQSLNMTSSIFWYDMDGDGDLDIFKTYTGMKLFGEMTEPPSIEVYLNRGNGTFEKGYSQEPDYMAGLVAVGSMDGGIRVFIGDYERNIVKVYRWENSELSHLKDIGSEGDFDTVHSMKLFDVDSDGELELLVLGTVDLITKVVRIYDDVLSDSRTQQDYEGTAGTTDFGFIKANSDDLWDLVGWEGSYMMTAGNKVWVALQKGEGGGEEGGGEEGGQEGGEEGGQEGGQESGGGGNETAEKGESGRGLLLYVGIILVIIVIVAVLLVLIKKKKGEE